MIARGCGVKVVTAVTGEARWPSPKSPWSGGEKKVSYVGALVEIVPIGMNRFFYLLSKNYSSYAIIATLDLRADWPHNRSTSQTRL